MLYTFLWVYYIIPFGFSLFWHFFVITFQPFKLPVWPRITDEVSIPEMRIWSMLLIKSNLKMVYTSKKKSLFELELRLQLVSVTAGGPVSPRGHMKPSSRVDFG